MAPPNRARNPAPGPSTEGTATPVTDTLEEVIRSQQVEIEWLTVLLATAQNETRNDNAATTPV